MGSGPLVSVITPAFNQAVWLPDCLGSVANQTYRPIQHIVVDDGSTDGTDGLRDSASELVQWIRQDNAGQSAALNRAFREGRGDIIGWLNSDDAFFDSAAVQRAVDAFEKHPEVDVVYGHAALVNSEGLILQLMWTPPFDPRVFRFVNFIVQPAAFVRRTALGDRIVDEEFDYAMDHDLWLRLLPDHRFKRIRCISGVDRHHVDRKGIARQDLVKADTQKLVEVHGVGGLVRHGWLHKLFNLGRRVMGLTLIPLSLRTQLAFAGARDSTSNLIFRQIARRRAAMPTGRPIVRVTK